MRGAHKERARLRIAIFVIKQAVREADLCCVLLEVRAEPAKQDEAMRGVKARTGGQEFSGTGVVKRQHSTLRRLRGRVRTVTGREPFISPERRLRVLRQRVALAVGAAAGYMPESTHVV